MSATLANTGAAGDPADPAGSWTVLVTDAERTSALSIVRSLGRAGVDVIAASDQPSARSFRSRYTAATAEYPSPKREPEAFAHAMLELVRRHDVDLVIPVTEDTLRPLADRREEFAAVTQLAIAEAEALAVSLDKQRTVALADELGIPVPRSEFLESERDAEAFIETCEWLSWPAVIKPQSSRVPSADDDLMEASTASYAAGPDDVLAALRDAGGRYGVLLQEYCGGRGSGVELLCDRGRIVAAFQHRRIAEVPITGGASALRESVEVDPDLLEYSRRLSEALSWTGLVMVEFRGDGTDARLMEINGRVWGSLPLAVQCGVDFPRLLAELHLGETDDLTKPAFYETGHSAHNPELMLVWFAKVLRGSKRAVAAPTRRDALPMWRTMRRAQSDLAASDDPAPARWTSITLLRKLVRKLSPV